MAVYEDTRIQQLRCNSMSWYAIIENILMGVWKDFLDNEAKSMGAKKVCSSVDVRCVYQNWL